MWEWSIVSSELLIVTRDTVHNVNSRTVEMKCEHIQVEKYLLSTQYLEIREEKVQI